MFGWLTSRYTHYIKKGTRFTHREEFKDIILNFTPSYNVN